MPARNSSTGTGLRLPAVRRTRRWREEGSFSSALLTFSLLLLVLALGFVFGRVVVARAYVKGTGSLQKAPEAAPGSSASAPAPADTGSSDTGAADEGASSEPGDTQADQPDATTGDETDASDTTVDGEPVDAGALPGGVRYAVQVGAFGSEDKARQAETQLTSAGYPARIVRESQGSRSTYKVLTGTYRTKDKAQKALTELTRDGFSEAFVVEERE